MQIDTEHLHYWMQAIRLSPDPIRTLDAFWRGQIQSKEWLVDNLAPFVKQPSFVEIHGGWVGTLASMLFQSQIPILGITSIDIDPSVRDIAIMMNKGEEIAGRFDAVTADMCAYQIKAEVIINTSCEHLTTRQFRSWIDKVPIHSLLVLQSNNYAIDEHLTIQARLEEFVDYANLDTLWSGELVLPLYTRYMVIGRIKNNH
jgi:hypothetical protein